MNNLSKYINFYNMQKFYISKVIPQKSYESPDLLGLKINLYSRLAAIPPKIGPTQ